MAPKTLQEAGGGGVMGSLLSEHRSGHRLLPRSQKIDSASECRSSGPEERLACILVPSLSGEGTRMSSQGHEFSICKVGPQTGLLGETTACPEVDPLLHEWLSPTSLQQGQIG